MYHKKRDPPQAPVVLGTDDFAFHIQIHSLWQQQLAFIKEFITYHFMNIFNKTNYSKTSR